MTKISNSDNILHFWLKSSIPGAFMVESDIIADYCLTYADLEQWLLQTNQIGCFYDDHPDATGDTIVTLEDFLADIDPAELDQKINEYFMENVIPRSGIEFEHLLQEYKHPDMWDFAPMPVSDTYQPIERQRPPDSSDRKEEKRLLNNI